MNETRFLDRLVDVVGDLEPGTVSLVGAGPGDTALISVRGAVRLAQADVVLADEAMGPPLRDLLRPEAQLILAGRRQRAHLGSQDEINQALVTYAGAGKRVVRLISGDPFISGRGCQECTYLAEAGVRFEVVPGIAAVFGASATAGIPLTHDALGRSFAVVAGDDESDGMAACDFGPLAKMETIAICLETKHLRAHGAHLIRAGTPAGTPVAVILQGTCPTQRTIIGTLGDIADRMDAEAVEGPSIILIGQVVRLRESIEWFERRPLHGQTIVVTRAPDQATGLRGALLAAGADVIEAPTIELADVEDHEPADKALRNVSEYDWLVLTSVNGVEAAFKRLEAIGADSRTLAGVRIAAVGTATAARLRFYGIRADLVPPDAIGESLAQGLIEQGVQGKRVLLLRAQVSREQLPAALREAGAICDDIAVYRTICPKALPAEFLARFDRRRIDWIVLTSPSSFVNLLTLLGSDRVAELSRIELASIGPVTTTAIRDRGLTETCEAKPHNVQGLVAAILANVRTNLRK